MNAEQQKFLQLAKWLTGTLSVPWTTALQALVTYGLQSGSYAAFPKFGKRTLKPGASDAEAAEYFSAFVGSYQTGRTEKLTLRHVGTVADPAVDVILSAFAGVQDQEVLAQARDLHRRSMAAENLLGALLERYLAQELEPHGWVWCAGNTLLAVDFLSADLSIALQVKNRSNSENSSSAKIRVGTQIKKWYRVNAKTGRTNWDAFPAGLDMPLSEEGFHAFIRAYADDVQ